MLQLLWHGGGGSDWWIDVSVYVEAGGVRKVCVIAQNERGTRATFVTDSRKGLDGLGVWGPMAHGLMNHERHSVINAVGRAVYRFDHCERGLVKEFPSEDPPRRLGGSSAVATLLDRWQLRRDDPDARDWLLDAITDVVLSGAVINPGDDMPVTMPLNKLGTHFHTTEHPQWIRVFTVDKCEKCGEACEGVNAMKVNVTAEFAESAGLKHQSRLPEAGWCDALDMAVCDNCYVEEGE